MRTVNIETVKIHAPEIINTYFYVKMDNVMLKNNEPINSNSSKFSLKENFSSTTTAAMITGLSENAFESIIKNIKAENFPLVPDESSDSDDLIERTETNEEINKKKLNQQKYKTCEVTTNEYQNNNENMSNKIDLNVSELNFQLQKNTDLLATCPTKNISGTSQLCTNQIPSKISLNTFRHTKLTHKCNKCCVWCKKLFAIFDNPNHIGRIRNIEKQNAFLKIEPTLNLNSCLCDRCFKYLEKTNKFNETEKRKGTNISSNAVDVTSVDEVLIEHTINESSIPIKKKKHKKRNRSRKRIGKADICSVHGCSKYSIHRISMDECTQIKQIFSTFDFSHIILIESKKKAKQLNCPLSVCDIHLPMINIIITCQLCGNKLDGNLDSKDWKMYEKWNLTLLHNNIPLKLKPGMFICITCQSYISEDSLSNTDLEILQRNVERRHDVCIQLFGPPQDRISKTCQVSNVGTSHLTSPIVIANMFKSDNSTKIKFTDPLITSTYYFTPDNNEYNHKHKGKKKLNCSEVKSNECTNMSSSFNKDKFPLDVQENLEYATNDNHCISNPESHIDKSKGSVHFDIEDNNYEPLVTRDSVDVSSNLNHNPRRFRILKMMGLVQKEVHIKSEYASSQLLEDNEGNLDAKLPKTQNDTFNNFTNVTFASNQNNVITACMDVEKDMLPSHVSSLLDNDKNDISKIDETKQYKPNKILFKVENNDRNKPMMKGIHSNQSSCTIEDVESDENMSLPVAKKYECRVDVNFPAISDVFANKYLCNIEDVESDENMSLQVAKQNGYRVVKDLDMNDSHQSESRVKDVENYENIPVNTSVYSDQNMCRVEDVENDENILVDTISMDLDQDRSNRVEDFKSDKKTLMNTGMDTDQIMYIVNPDENCMNVDKNYVDHVLYVNTVNLKNPGQDSNPIESLKATTDPIEVRRKLRNVICQRISNGLMKKRMLDDKTTDKFVVKKPRLDKTPESNEMLLYKSENKTNNLYKKNFIANNSVEFCTNDDSYNSNSTDFSTSDEETNSIDKWSANELSIQIENTYSLDSNCTGPLRFHRTLKKVDDFYNTDGYLNALNEVRTFDNMSNNRISGTDILPDCETMSDDGNLSNNVIVLDDPLEHEKGISNPKIKRNESTHKYHIFPQPYKLSDDDKNKFSHLIIQEEDDLEDDRIYDLSFKLDKSNRQIYRHLLNKFKNESHIFNYLMENERMFYNKELIISKTANKVTMDYLNKHLAALYQIYGDPKYNKADVSYLLDDPARIRKFSKRSTTKIGGISSVSTCTTPIGIITTVNNVSQVQKNLTTTTSTKTKPITSSQIFNFVPATKNIKNITTITKPNVNLQSSRFIKPTPNIFQPIVQPSFKLPTTVRSSFKLPTAVRSKGMSFMQTNKSNCPLRPTLMTHIVRN